jgi:16S rRNA (cytosine1402-N4)-methyltransferase
MTYHQPVLLKESLELLNLKKGGVYVDATLGGGGHTEAILKNSLIKQVYAFDQDEDAINYATERLKKYSNKLTILKVNFSEMRSKLAMEKVSGIDGVLFDLGISSHQIDEAGRGFSFDKNAELDMRMDRHTETTAKDILNNLSVNELSRIFREYGEEQNSYKIALWIDKGRKLQPLETTQDLAHIIESNMRGNPILVIKTKARIFQALRIYINHELEVLDTAIEDSINLLNPKGRLVVISYHSLEDRIVKTRMNQAAKGCICPKTILKCMCNQKPKVKIITNKVVKPSEGEQQSNSRSRSAKLRAVEKLEEDLK